MSKIAVSRLPHTWLIDVDGTLLKHNGHKHGGDVLLPGVREFWSQIPANDIIVLLSARTAGEEAPTLAFLQAQGLRYDRTVFDLPTGERILVNDSKPRGLATALAVNIPRDVGLGDLAIELTDE